MAFSDKGKDKDVVLEFNSQTIGEKVYRQKGNSPDRWLKSLNAILSEKN